MVIELLMFLILIKSKVLKCHDHYNIGNRHILTDDVEVNTVKYFDSKNGFNEEEIKKFLKSINVHIRDETPVRVEDPNQYCQSFESCYECVKSIGYPCNWCHNAGCTNVGHKLCPLTTKKSFGNANSTCPYIHHEGPIVLSSGIRTHIEVKIHVPYPTLYDQDIICQIKLRQKTTHVKGLIVNDMVYCFPVKLETNEHVKLNRGSFKLIWGGMEPFSNELPVVVYRCERLGEDCDSCRMLPSKYGCGWCAETEECVIVDKCNNIISWSMNRLKCQFNNRKMFFV